MATRISIARAARQLASRSHVSSTAFACQSQRWQQQQRAAVTFPQRRLFSGTGAAATTKRYTTDHEWISLSSDKSTATVGISEYAAEALGDVVYIELPEVGLEVEAGDTIGAVESVKSASDILSPVAGKVVEVNDVLQEKPGTVNKDPEGEAWIAKIEVTGELEDTMSKQEYAAFTEE